MVDIYKQIGGAGGGSGATAYTQSFNATTSWGTASGGLYSITIPETTHARGAHPVIQVYELVGGDYELVDVNDIIVDGVGNVTMTVTEISDARFQGKIIILGE